MLYLSVSSQPWTSMDTGGSFDSLMLLVVACSLCAKPHQNRPVVFMLFSHM